MSQWQTDIDSMPTYEILAVLEDLEKRLPRTVKDYDIPLAYIRKVLTNRLKRAIATRPHSEFLDIMDHD